MKTITDHSGSLTTTRTVPDYTDRTKYPPRVDPVLGASFPPLDTLPADAAQAVAQLQELYVRQADATEARAEAHAALEAARKADAAALFEHVKAGGTAADFVSSSRPLQKALDDAQTDVDLISRLVSDQVVTTCGQVQQCHDEGAPMAAQAAEEAAQCYQQAINDVIEARREYLGACSGIFFWRNIMEKGQAVVSGGDQIITRRGPITKIDHSLIQCLRLDAETHTRLAELPTEHL